MGAQNAKADLEEYRQGYPRLRDDPRQKDNLRFYKGEIQSVPSGDFIDNIHEKWKGNYSLLERHHGYIQWLFPIREHGMNMQSQVLQLHEAEGIKSDPECMKRVLRSYELMLDFFGMKLKDPETGELERAENYKQRYRNLNTSSHNYLRITRILKSLGELGYEHLKFNFLAFVAAEVWEHGELRNTKSSLANYWSGTLRDDTQRAEIERRIKEYKKAAGEDDEDDYYRRDYGNRYRGAGSSGGGRVGGRSAADEHSQSRKGRTAYDDDSDDDGEEEKDYPSTRRAQVNPRPAQRAGANANANAIPSDDDDDDSDVDSGADVPADANANPRSKRKAGESDQEDEEENEAEDAPKSTNTADRGDDEGNVAPANANDAAQ